jgi:WD40 repeat protein
MTTFNRQWEVFLTDTTSPNAYPQITLWKSVYGFSRDSKRIIVSTNKAIEVWQLEPRELVGRFHLPIEPLNRVTLVELSPDGDTLAIRCEDGLRVYSLSTSQERMVLPEYFVAEHYPNGGWGTKEAGGDSTFGLKFSPDGNVMVAWGEYGLKFFDMEDNAKEFKFVPVTRKMPGPTENYTSGAAFLSDGQVTVSWGKYGLKFFDMDRKAKEFRSVSTPRVCCLAFAPDEKTFATGDCEGRLILWNTSDGKRLGSVRFRGGERPVLTGE